MSMRGLIRSFPAAALIAASLSASAADWPRWRGPSADANSPETGLLRAWPADGPPQLWRVDGLGGGYSTPIVVGDQLYLIVSRGNDEFALALSTADGSTLWEQRIGSVGAPDQNPSYPGARSTPTADGDRLYAMSSDGDLACLDRATGAIKWSKHVRREFNGRLGTWAYAESPVIDGDKLLCTPGGPEATLLALNKLTGDVIWKSAIPGADAAGYATIVIDESLGVRQYIQFLGSGLVGVDAATGRFLWRFDDTARNSPANIPTPIAHDGRVYSGSSRGGGALIQLSRDGDNWSTQLLYASGQLPSGIGGAVLHDGHLYAAAGQGFACIELATGRDKWRTRSVPGPSVIQADGLLILHGENDELALVEATPAAYRELGRFTPRDAPNLGNSKAWTHPVLSNGKLYIHTLGTVWCYDLAARAG